MPRIEDASFVVVDTETTGTRTGEDRLIEVGAVRVVGGAVVDTFEQLVDPERHVPSRIARLTGLTTASVFGEPTAAAVLPRFVDFLGDAVLVAHNLAFDLRFLQAELDRAGLPPLENEGVCTLRLARRLLPGLPSRGLAALCTHFGVRPRTHHRALADAEAAAEVLLRLLDRLRTGFGLTTVADVVAFQRKRYKDAAGEPKHVQQIRREVLPELPDRPGVYTFKRKNGEVLYVGKAKSLRNRVRSYFSAIDAHPDRLRKLVRDLRGVEWEETGSELAALLLESKRIKRLLPRYNRAGRRYRDFPFLRLDTTARYPTLSWTPVLRADGAAYYGPLGKRSRAEETVELANKLFGLRECDAGTFQSAQKAGRPCLYAEMGRCLAPCTGTADAAYAAEVERVRRFLAGTDGEALQEIEAAMRAAAANLDFEAAAWYRDRLERMRRLQARQRPFASPVQEVDAVLVEPSAEAGRVQLFVVRFGRLVERRELPVPAPPEDAEALHACLARHFDPDLEPSPFFGRVDVDEIRILAHWMRQRRRTGREVRWQPGRPATEVADAVLAAAEAVVLPIAGTAEAA